MMGIDMLYIQVLIGVIVVSLTIFIGVIYCSPSKPKKPSSSDKSGTDRDDNKFPSFSDYKNLLDSNYDGDILYGETDKYTWNQNESEIEMFIMLDEYYAQDKNINAKDIKITIKSTTLMVIINGSEVINGEFYEKVIPDDCSWLIDTLRSGKKQLWFTFMKATPTVKYKHWKSLLKGDQEMKASKLGPPVLGVDSSDPKSMKNAIDKSTRIYMSLYGPPPNVSVAEALYLIFSHYCSPWKSPISNSNNNNNSGNETGSSTLDTPPEVLVMDAMNFARMCRESPNLNKYISRTDIDVVFSTTRPKGVRRLEYDHFLDVLLELAVRIFPNEDPIIGLANFLARFVFALFDQQPSHDGEAEIEKIIDALSI